MKIDGPLGDQERSDAEASHEREKEIYRSLCLPSRRHLSVSGFFFLRARETETGETPRDAWLLKRGGVMTRTICSGVSTRLFLFSNTAEHELSFSSSASPYPVSSFPTPRFFVPHPLPLSRRLPALVSPLRSPTDDEAGRRGP